MNSNSVIIALDGKPHAVPIDTTLEALVTGVGHAAQTVSTAINGDFVPRAQRVSRVLVAGDAVLMFQPIVGG